MHVTGFVVCPRIAPSCVVSVLDFRGEALAWPPLPTLPRPEY